MSVDAAALAPTACGRCRTPLEREDLRCTICGLAAPQHRQTAAIAKATIVRCDGCGAALSYNVEVQAPRCAYCGSVAHLETPEDPLEQARAFLPFEVQPHQAQQALKAFLSRKAFFRPSDLGSASTVASLQALWWPAWVFNARALVSWTADSDAGAGRSAWAPHSGQTPLVFRNIVVSASRGLTDAECATLSAAYDLGKARESAAGPDGAIVERFDVTRSGARRRIIEAVEAVARQSVSSVEVPGKRRRNLKVAVLLSGLETERYALPAYVLAYRYGKNLYRVVVHGQDASCLIGKAPYSIWKILLAVLGGVAAATLIAVVLALMASQ